MTYNPNFVGSTATASKKIQSPFTSGTGALIPKANPVSLTASGTIIPIDISDETSVYRIVGLCGQDLAGGETGEVIDTGRLEDVTIGYSVGDPLYISKAGFLTNARPDIGVDGFVAGDWVVFIGLVVKNLNDPLKKDIKLMIDIVGQL
jgi:hypothetical protein